MVWTFVLTAVAMLLAYVWLQSRRPKNYPPGPRGLPFLGNITAYADKPEKKMLEWKQKFGDIFAVYNGKTRLVILSDFHTVRRVFNDENVQARNNNTTVRMPESPLPLSAGLISSQGDTWRTHRRFALSTLRNLGMGKNWLEDTIIAEVEDMGRVLLATNQKPYDPKTQLTNSIANVICALIFGKRFELSDPKFSRLTQLLGQSIANVHMDIMASNVPAVMWLPNWIRTKVLQSKQNLVELTDFLRECVKEHEAVLDQQADDGAADYLFAYQQEKNGGKSDGKASFDEKQLLGSLFDLFLAGTDTTSTTTIWAMVFMIENPDVMRKVQEEIDNNIGRQKMLTSSDRALLPYTEAVILEVQRCASLVPLGVPHMTHEDVTIDGYTIPEGTVVAANLYSIHRDPRYWKNPEKFDPLRFLDENKKLLRPDGFAPFSIGKRACLGESLAKMELFLFIANMLRGFTLQLPPGKTLTHEDYASSVVNSPLPFELIFVPRSK